jgi:CheY-like chemotaxis protein
MLKGLDKIDTPNAAGDIAEPQDSADGGNIKPRLLAVDDSEYSAELTSRFAERCGFETRFVTDAMEVTEIVKNWHPDVVATDICMPEMDAIELFGALSECGFDGELILISGHDEKLRGQARRLAEIKRLQVRADLQKPLELKSLRAVLNPDQATSAAADD